MKVRMHWNLESYGIWDSNAIYFRPAHQLLPSQRPGVRKRSWLSGDLFPPTGHSKMTSSSEGLPLMPPTPEVWREWNGELGRVGFRRGSLWNGYHIKGRQQARRLRNPDTGRQCPEITIFCPEITMPGRFGSAAHANSIFLRAARSGFSWPGWDKQRAFCRSQPSIFLRWGKAGKSQCKSEGMAFRILAPRFSYACREAFQLQFFFNHSNPSVQARNLPFIFHFPRHVSDVQSPGPWS